MGKMHVLRMGKVEAADGFRRKKRTSKDKKYCKNGMDKISL